MVIKLNKIMHYPIYMLDTSVVMYNAKEYVLEKSKYVAFVRSN